MANSVVSFNFTTTVKFSYDKKEKREKAEVGGVMIFQNGKDHNRTNKFVVEDTETDNILVISPGNFKNFCRANRLNYMSAMCSRIKTPNRNICLRSTVNKYDNGFGEVSKFVLLSRTTSTNPRY